MVEKARRIAEGGLGRERSTQPGLKAKRDAWRLPTGWNRVGENGHKAKRTASPLPLGGARRSDDRAFELLNCQMFKRSADSSFGPETIWQAMMPAAR